MRSLTAFSMMVAGLRPFGAREALVPRSSRKRRASAWTVSDDLAMLKARNSILLWKKFFR